MKRLFSVVKFLGVVNRFGELKVVNLLLLASLGKLLLGPVDSTALFLVAMALTGKALEDVVDLARRRGLWDEMVKLQTLQNKLAEYFTKEKAERERKWEEFERDYTETKRAVALLNNKSILGQMHGMTLAQRKGV
jgi:hypothetical protein